MTVRLKSDFITSLGRHNDTSRQMELFYLGGTEREVDVSDSLFKPRCPAVDANGDSNVNKGEAR